MRAIITCLIIGIMLAPPERAGAVETSFKPRLGCVPFLATSLQAMAFTENISSSFLDSLDRHGYFETVERRKIEQVLEVEGLRLDNLTPSDIIRIGSKAGLDYVVYGSVSSTASGITLDIHLVAIRSQQMLTAESFRMSESDFSRRLQEIAAGIAEKVRNAGAAAATAAEMPAISAPPPPPGHLEATGTANSIRLTWLYGDVKQIAGFNVYRAPSPESRFVLHATTVEPSFTDENLKLNEVFYYRVALVGRNGSVSEMSPPVRGATAIAPPAPIFMHALPDIKGARLAWRPRPSGGDDPRMTPQGFRVYRRQGNEERFTLSAELPADLLTYVDSGLAEGTTYTYAVTAHNSDGAESEFSAHLAVTPLPPPPAPRPASGRIQQVSLVWDQYPSELIAGYIVYRATERDGRYSVIGRTDSPAVTCYDDRGLADNTTYWYRLSAYKQGGTETGLSEPASAVTRDIPPAPLNLSAVSGQPRKVTLRWRLGGVPEDEIRQIVIYRSRDAQGAAEETAGEVGADQTEFVDGMTPLLDNTTYYYRISARNSGGALSPRTGQVAATTKAPPAVPSGLVAVSGEIRKISLRWNTSPEQDIRGYRIFRKLPAEADFSLLRESAATAYEDTGLGDGAEVAYRIRAVDRDGLESDYSGVVTARTKPLPARVSGIRAEDPVARVVTWQPNRESDIVGYAIYKRGFLGMVQKLADTRETRWKSDELRGRLEVYVTAVDAGGLESEPSEPVVFE
jgi:fibronectin type 3 domain-containing protein/TolB-like protein